MKKSTIILSIFSILSQPYQPLYAATCTASSDATLRNCITYSIAGDTINITSDITLSNYLPDIAKNLTIQGNNFRISGNNATRVFWVESGNVTISNLTIANGLAQGDIGGGGGAGLGAGLFVNSGAVFLSDSIFDQNVAVGGIGGNAVSAYGGGMGEKGGGGIGGDSGYNSNGYGGGNGEFGGGGGNGGTGDAEFSGGTGGKGGFGGGGGGGGTGCYCLVRPPFSPCSSWSCYVEIGGTGGFGGGKGGGEYEGGYLGGPGGFGGGGLGAGAAIFAKAGTITLKKVAFTQNSNSGGTGANGGQGKATIFICTSAEDASCAATVTADSCGVTFSGSTATASFTDVDNADTFGVSRTNLTTACLIKPTAITNVPSVITSSSATLKGTVTPKGAATTVSFDFGTTTAYGQSIAATPATIAGTAAATAVSANKTGLICNTTYNYRVKAVNSAGTSYGANVSFKTAICPGPIVVTKAATGVTATAATLNGTVTPNGAAVTAVTFDFGTTTAYGQSIAAVPGSIQVGAAVTAVRASKTALVCNTTYNYRIKAVNSKGTSYGANITFKTTDCLGSIVVTKAATGVTATAATLNGTVTPNGAAVTAVTFDFGTTTAYGQSIAAVPGSIAVGAAATAVRSSKTGLICNTTYHYRVKAVNSKGTSYGANMSFKTTDCPVSKPDLVITSATLSPATPAAGSTFSVTLTVKNQGTLAATGNFLEVWTNQATAQTCGAAGDNWAYVDPLAAGASTTMTVTDLTADVAGAKTLRAFVDSACEVMEANETNNQMIKTYSVQ